MNKVCLFSLFFVLSLFFVSFASGLEVVVDKYDYGCYDTTNGLLAAVYPSASATLSAASVSFRPFFDSSNLTVVQWAIFKSGSPSGFVYCTIEGSSGIWGSTNVPNGTVYATSNYVSVAGLSTAISLVNFTFVSGYVFDATQVYTCVLYGYNGTVATCNVGRDTTVPINHAGNSAYFTNSMWSPTSSYDYIFYVYGVDGDAVSFSSDGDVIINQVTNVYEVTASSATATVGSVTAEFNNTSVSAGAVSAGAVTAGDVTASGAVTVSSVNAEFNNTSVSATGDVVTGDISANFNNTSVTADSATATINSVTVEASIADNGTVTLNSLGGDSVDASSVVLIFLVCLSFVSMLLFERAPFIGFFVGFFTSLGGLYYTLGGAAGDSLLMWFGLFASVLGTFTIVICAFGYRIRGRRR